MAIPSWDESITFIPDRSPFHLNYQKLLLIFPAHLDKAALHQSLSSLHPFRTKIWLAHGKSSQTVVLVNLLRDPFETRNPDFFVHQSPDGPVRPRIYQIDGCKPEAWRLAVRYITHYDKSNEDLLQWLIDQESDEVEVEKQTITLTQEWQLKTCKFFCNEPTTETLILNLICKTPHHSIPEFILYMKATYPKDTLVFSDGYSSATQVYYHVQDARSVGWTGRFVIIEFADREMKWNWAKLLQIIRDSSACKTPAERILVISESVMPYDQVDRSNFRVVDIDHPDLLKREDQRIETNLIDEIFQEHSKPPCQILDPEWQRIADRAGFFDSSDESEEDFEEYPFRDAASSSKY